MRPASKDNVNALVRNRFKNFFFNPVIPFFAYCSLRFLYEFNQIISPVFINRKLSIFSFIHICLTPIYLENSSLLLFRLVFLYIVRTSAIALYTLFDRVIDVFSLIKFDLLFETAHYSAFQKTNEKFYHLRHYFLP